ncbi:AraC family transcriptional regulator [Paenibacillus sp. M1]|uniref:AraC family transcriptional regulator n=1 Tax=Paenibacillus haidiansis TaxID=1574488 RepID=A0ABU7VVL8_9BACL
MYEWNEMVQRMIDWVDEHPEVSPSLLEMAEQLGYSPYYCTKRFHTLTGMTLRDYVRIRRISRVALELRDTNERILDIAVKYGFSSQEALTRAFVKAFGITPNAYRKSKRPIPLAIRQEVYSPYHYAKKEQDRMSAISSIQHVEIKVEVIPEHQFIGIWDPQASGYHSFWKNGHNCDDICGSLESMSVRTLTGQLGQLGGWYYENGHKGYLYGIAVPAEDTGMIPEGMEQRSISRSEYLVFYHPAYDYMKDNWPVMQAVEALAWNFNPESLGYVWDYDGNKQDYQRHFPEGYGYAVARPVKRA